MFSKSEKPDAPIAPAFTIPGVSPEFPPSLLAAGEALKAKAELAHKARAGEQTLANKLAELRRRAAELSASDASSEEMAMTAAAMGLADALSRRQRTPAEIDANRAARKAIDDEIETVARAHAAAPALLDEIRQDLVKARTTFEREFAAASAPLLHWADHTERTLSAAKQAVNLLRASLNLTLGIAGRAERSDVAPGHPLALIPALAEFSGLHDAAIKGERILDMSYRSWETSAVSAAGVVRHPRLAGGAR